MVRPDSRTAYSAGHFELLIDGHATTSYLKSVDGGWVKSTTADSPMASYATHVKQNTVWDIDPMSLEFGLAGAGEVLEWIQKSWQNDPSRRSGQIAHADFNMNITYVHEFFEALVAETTFPALDGAAKEAAYLKCKLQPERVVVTKATGNQKVAGRVGAKQKAWLPSSFRVNIDGIDEAKYINKVESFTIKQGVKKMYTGSERFPQIIPTSISFPNLVCTIAEGYATKLFEWHHDVAMKGSNEVRGQKTGSIEFLSPDRGDVLFTINLFEMSLNNLSIMQASANADAIKRVKFELFVGRMELDVKGRGLETSGALSAGWGQG